MIGIIFCTKGLFSPEKRAKSLFYLPIRIFVFVSFSIILENQFVLASFFVSALLILSSIFWWLNEKVEKRSFSPLETFTINGKILGIFHFPKK